MADLTFNRDGAGIALLDGKIYVSGGYYYMFPRKRTTCHRFECYDISTKTWTTLASMNHDISDHSLLVMNNGFLLAVGGNVGSIEEHDVINDTWTVKEDNLDDKPCGGFIMLKYHGPQSLIILLFDSNIPSSSNFENNLLHISFVLLIFPWVNNTLINAHSF